jgi:hypothetical protein
MRSAICCTYLIMVETVLDYLQRLVGRGFLIAALVPSVIFCAAAVAIWEGVDGLHSRVEGWFEGGFSQSASAILLAISTIYLFAYVLYGVRATLHRIYQGRWPRPLRIFERPGLRLEQRAWKASRQKLDERTAALDIRMWVEEKNFGEAYPHKRLTEQQASDLLGDTVRTHRRLTARLERGKSLKETTYSEILANTLLLCANPESLPANLHSQLDELIRELRRQYDEREDMRLAIVRLDAVADRQRMAAYEEFVSSFSEDERWLRSTRLGNVMSSVDAGILSRYGINLTAIWPRLVHVVPADSRRHIDDANTFLDFSVIMSTLSLLTVGVACVAARYGEPRDMVVSLSLAALGVVFFSIFYRLSVLAARAFTAQVEAIVDLFRLKLLDALDFERPSTPAMEKKAWTELRMFIVQAEPTRTLRFKRRQLMTPQSR